MAFATSNIQTTLCVNKGNGGKMHIISIIGLLDTSMNNTYILCLNPRDKEIMCDSGTLSTIMK